MVGACVEGFDHYCVFIDNTVGGGNHRIFVTVLCFEILMQILYSVMYVYALKTVFYAAPFEGKRMHLCGIFVAMLFNGGVLCGLTGLCKEQCGGICQNLTFYEILKRQSLPHFWPAQNKFQNPFNDGCLGNCIAFWTKSRRMTVDPDDPWAESNRRLADSSSACQRMVRSLCPGCSCARRARTADENNSAMKDV
jgi:hypothetical protein